MSDKEKEILEAATEIFDTLQDIIPFDHEDILRVMRRLMDAKELQVFDLANFYEQEVVRAQQAGAHLAACLMCAAMNEALLALMCLKYEASVITTNQYKFSTRKKEKPFRDVIAGWGFEQLITVAEENEWVPANIVSGEIKAALANGYRELMPAAHPEMTALEVEQGAQTFFYCPGTAMLRMTQDLRNSIHAGKWLRSNNNFIAEHFTQWCRFATILGAEIRTCLLHLIMQRAIASFSKSMLELNKKLHESPPEFRAIFEALVRAKLNN